MARNLTIAIIAGESSGDQLGANIMRGLRQIHTADISFCGVGGRAMASEGLRSWFPIEEITVIGFHRLLFQLPHLWRRIRQTARNIIAARPDLLIIIDSPDFTHRAARRAKARLPDLPVVNYAPPQIWAWRPARGAKMRRYIDRAISVLPFEPAEFACLDAPECYYAGHPLLDAEYSPDAGADFRRRHNIAADQPLLLLAPGSRVREIGAMAQAFADAALALQRKHPRMQTVFLSAPGLGGLLAKTLAGHSLRPILTSEAEEEKRAALAAANLALIASGTMTLETALAGVPFICAYHLNRFEEWLMHRFFHGAHVCMVNLILDRRAIPEYLGRSATESDRLALALGELFSGAAREGVERALAETMKAMGGGDSARRAAELALDLVQPRVAGIT